MGAGFIRRYASNPGQAELGKIEGVAIIDNPPPGVIQGVNSGCVCVFGECADATYAVTVAANGDVSAKPRPVNCAACTALPLKACAIPPVTGRPRAAASRSPLSSQSAERRTCRITGRPWRCASRSCSR